MSTGPKSSSGRKSVAYLLRDLEKRDDLPSLPQIVVRLNAVARDPKSSASDLANIILRDQSLTSRVLRISNSALYTSSQSDGIGTVTQAVIALGFQQVVRLAMGVAVFNMLDTVSRDHHLLRIWIHSIACAVAAEGLARNVRTQGMEEAFVAGLLHDVGKLILLRHARSAYQRVLDRVDHGEDQALAESEELGHTHADVGEAVARRWKLPDSLVAVLANHDEFGGPKEQLRNTVVLANQIAKLQYPVVPGSSTRTLADLERTAKKRLGLPAEKLAAVLSSLPSLVDECLDIFGLHDTREAKRTEHGADSAAEEQLRAIFVQMQADVHRKSEQLGLLRQISQALVQETRSEFVLSMILEGLYVSLQLERLALAMTTGSGAPGQQGFGQDMPGVLSLLNVEDSGHPLRDLLHTGAPLNVTDRTLPTFNDRVRAWEWPAPAFAVVPVPGAKGPAGLLVADRGTRPLSDDDLEMMALFANQISLALDERATRT